EATGAGKRREILALDHEAQVSDVDARPRALQEVDDRRRVDSHRRERCLAAAPLLHPLARETEHALVPRERSLDIGGDEDGMVEPGDLHVHLAILARTRSARETEDAFADDGALHPRR